MARALRSVALCVLAVVFRVSFGGAAAGAPADDGLRAGEIAALPASPTAAPDEHQPLGPPCPAPPRALPPAPLAGSVAAPANSLPLRSCPRALTAAPRGPPSPLA